MRALRTVAVRRRARRPRRAVQNYQPCTNLLVYPVCRFADGTPSRRALRTTYSFKRYKLLRRWLDIFRRGGYQPPGGTDEQVCMQSVVPARDCHGRRRPRNDMEGKPAGGSCTRDAGDGVPYGGVRASLVGRGILDAPTV